LRSSQSDANRAFCGLHSIGPTYQTSRDFRISASSSGTRSDPNACITSPGRNGDPGSGRIAEVSTPSSAGYFVSLGSGGGNARAVYDVGAGEFKPRRARVGTGLRFLRSRGLPLKRSIGGRQLRIGGENEEIRNGCRSSVTRSARFGVSLRICQSNSVNPKYWI
jgi:hypothetical protein